MCLSAMWFCSVSEEATPMFELCGGLLRGRCAEARKINQLLGQPESSCYFPGYTMGSRCLALYPPPISSAMGLASLIQNACNPSIVGSLFILCNNEICVIRYGVGPESKYKMYVFYTLYTHSLEEVCVISSACLCLNCEPSMRFSVTFLP